MKKEVSESRIIGEKYEIKFWNTEDKEEFL